MRFFCSAGTRCHSRMMSGPWLAAKAPTRLAIGIAARTLARRTLSEPPDEFIVLHAGGEEVVAQEIRVGARGEEGHVVLGDRLLDALLQRVPGENGLPIRAKLGRSRGRLQVEEELREPVVAHQFQG